MIDKKYLAYLTEIRGATKDASGEDVWSA